ncbi:hypothetical protein [Sorangium sp. So ce542]|uniref:hypothetical protein n=1 Tax=Sorangium sp. So ce542 TaxID=3133316 RepID=UPI003F5D61C6
MAVTIVIDAAGGRARIGRTEIAIAQAGTRGELRVGGASGPVLRPLTFGERTRLCARAAACPSPRDALCGALLGAALGGLAVAPEDRAALEVLALALAGAEEPAPSFVDTTVLVARATGWDPAQLYDVEAAEIDRIAARLGSAARPGGAASSGWRSFVIADGDGDGDVRSARAELADRLLERSGGAREVEAPREDVDAGAAWSAPDAQRTGAPAAGPSPEALAAIQAAFSGQGRQAAARTEVGGGAAALPPGHVPGRVEVDAGIGAAPGRRTGVGPSAGVTAASAASAAAPPAPASAPAASRARSAAPRAPAVAPRVPQAATHGAWTTAGAALALAPWEEPRPQPAAPTLVPPAALAALHAAPPPASAPHAQVLALAPPGLGGAPAAAACPDAAALADAIAALLDEECDLRGLDR